MRKSGILLPIASLPSDYGIGTFSSDAYEFVDLLRDAGQSLWQILPLGQTGYGDSPYQSFSTFAGNPYYIDLKAFIKKGWLTKEECEAPEWGTDAHYIDYDKVYENRYTLLRKAYENSKIAEDKEFQVFCKENAFWLDDYALYREIKAASAGKCWNEWEDKYRLRDKKALAEFSEEYAEGLLYQKFMQYEFWVQWSAVKEYANDNNIKIIGDIPIYVAFDSADSWANPELFQFDKEGKPVSVAGCPPDAFSKTGQLWGNPLYNWEYHKKTGYKWWINRIAHCKKLYDVIRIDHFRGFEAYYAIPYGDKTAENGKWEKGPGIELFRTIEKEVEGLEIIAEDLGVITDAVRELLDESGYPGMKVLAFAFGGDEPSAYIPYNHVKNAVVYTGTHDNDTLMGWYRNLSKEDRALVLEYIGRDYIDEGEAVWEVIRMAHASVCDTCIIPIQDYLCLGSEARINEPSTLGKNWKWRLEKDQISVQLIKDIKKMTMAYGRCERPKPVVKKAKTEEKAETSDGKTEETEE